MTLQKTSNNLKTGKTIGTLLKLTKNLPKKSASFISANDNIIEYQKN